MSETVKSGIEPVYKHYVIDMSCNNNFVQVPSVQGDGNQVRRIEIELIANGTRYPIDREKVIVTIAGTKPDTKHILNPCTVTEEGFILVDITYQMSAAAGRGDYQIALMDVDTNSMIKSFPFHIVTTKSPLDASALSSSDEYQFLVETVSKALADYEYVMESAQNSADAAKASETMAKDSAKLSESWAVGKTGTRTGEDTNNSKYYAERSSASASNASNSASKAYGSEIHAAESASNSSDFARESEDYSKTSKSYAVGGTGTRTGEDTDNSKFYSEKSKEYSNSWKGSLLPKGTIAFAGLPTSGNIAGHMYNIREAFVTDSRFKDGAGYSYPAGTNVYRTSDGKWDCLSGTLTKVLTQDEYDSLSHAEKMNGTTYYITDSDNSIADASADSAGLLSPADKRKLDGIAEGAEANVQADWNTTDSGSDSYIKNKPSVYTKSEVDNKLSALETAIDWKEAVPTFSDITSAYPNPEDGWTVNVKDTAYTYRYNGTEWVVISANAIPKATQNVDGLLSKEDKAAYDDADSKKHTHGNKNLLDSISVVNNTRDSEKTVASAATADRVITYDGYNNPHELTFHYKGDPSGTNPPWLIGMPSDGYGCYVYNSEKLEVGWAKHFKTNHFTDSVIDFNNFTTAGCWACFSNADAVKFLNCPTKNAHGLIVIPNSGVTQIVIEFMPYPKQGRPKIYFRNYYDWGKEWGDWARIYTEADPPTSSATFRELTQAQYYDLSDSEKLNGTAYFITDAN